MNTNRIREKLLEIKKAEMNHGPGSARVFNLVEEAIDLLREGNDER